MGGITGTKRTTSGTLSLRTDVEIMVRCEVPRWCLKDLGVSSR